jgi:hypothetical protein
VCGQIVSSDRGDLTLILPELMAKKRELLRGGARSFP